MVFLPVVAEDLFLSATRAFMTSAICGSVIIIIIIIIIIMIIHVNIKAHNRRTEAYLRPMLRRVPSRLIHTL